MLDTASTAPCCPKPTSSREGLPSFAASFAAELVPEPLLEELLLALFAPEELLELDELPPEELLLALFAPEELLELDELPPEELEELELELVEVEPATMAASATATVADVGDPKLAAPTTVVSDTVNVLPSAPTPTGTLMVRGDISPLPHDNAPLLAE
jgi:hypothetical protein